MNILKTIGGCILLPVALALFYGLIWLDRATAAWKKFYYTKRGIKFYVTSCKHSDIVYRLDK